MIKIHTFGIIAEIVGKQEVLLESAFDLEDLKKQLLERYPTIRDLDFLIAINKKIITENTLLTKNQEIAVLPPFSGG